MEKDYTRQGDLMLGQLLAEVNMLKAQVVALVEKVDKLTETKNKGLGVILAIGTLSSILGAAGGILWTAVKKIS